ncbi:hypothetical protein M3Y99_00031800 [Aphelenchoides fujianensis]|nr:hypothetical protein M3Y99_00031800 [Aphelenchoides fujianensis]
MPPEQFAQQPPLYGYFAGPPEVYSPNEMFGAGHNFAQMPYGYANLPGQPDYPPLTALPPPLASQQANPTANFSPQPHPQLAHSGGPRQQLLGHPQFPTQPPPAGPPPPRVQHFQAGFANNAAFYPQVQSAQPSSSTISNPTPAHAQQQDQRSKLPPVFDNAADSYTASWVSSTSSIPPDMKVPPDQISPDHSPLGGHEYGSWAPDGMNAMSANRQSAPNRVYAQGCGPPNSQMSWQNPAAQQGAHMMQQNAPIDLTGGHGQMYGAYETNGGNGFVHSNFVVQPADQMGAPPPQHAPHHQQHPMKNRRGGNGGQEQPQHFAGNGNANQAKMGGPPPPQFMYNAQQAPFFPPNAAYMMPPMFAGGGFQYQQAYMPPAGIRMPQYYPQNYQPFFHPMMPMQVPVNPFYPADARPLSPQLERFHNTWLDQDLPPMEQLAVEQSLMPMALAHNAAQFGRASRGHFGNGGGGPNGRHGQTNSLLTATHGVRSHYNGGGGGGTSASTATASATKTRPPAAAAAIRDGV